MMKKKNLSSKMKRINDTIFDNLYWLRTDEAARYLRMSANALRIAVCRKEIKSYKWRRRLYFKKDDLDNLLRLIPLKGGFNGNY